MPSHIQVTYRGQAGPAEVADVLAAYDLMILPTTGENFGHVIVESLAAGCPVLISDRTPWRRLAEHGVGWDLPLHALAPWEAALQQVAVMDDAEHRALSARALGFAEQWLRAPEVEQATLAVLQEATAD